MTLNQLEYFQKVATLQHFRQAAELLKISQPSLSRSMSLLEEKLGLMLFEHQGRNVVLTKSGRVFLEHVNRILEEVHIAEHKMKQLAGSMDILISPMYFRWQTTIFRIQCDPSWI